MEGCIFCQIIAGHEPCHKIYEDTAVLAILVPRPIRAGHCIILSKKHYEDFLSLPEDLVAHTAIVAQRIGHKMKTTLFPRKVGAVLSGFGVSHFHYHVIPLYDEQDISSSAYVRLIDGEIRFKTEFCKKAEDDQLKDTARLLNMEE